ncbi:MAG TPA: hypothetical protein VMB03_02135 [Bryobacteraceae bacterium]|nr:hypothetical protein [Bryobacteraceae bacterium]
MNHQTEVREALDRIAASDGFRRSQRLIRLLRYTCEAVLEGRAAELKETTLGIDVYERGPDFDPRVDGIVRVEANRLRRKLQEYYSGAGQSDPLRIEYAKGSYVPSFTGVSAPAPPEAPKRYAALRFAAIASAVLLCAAAWVVSRSAHSRGPSPSFAVLPFRDLTAGASMEHVALGVTDEIKTGLAGIPGVRVIARATPEDLPKLGVDFVLEGDVRAAGIRAAEIEARLVRVKDGVYVWSRAFAVGAGASDDSEAIESSIVRDAARAAGVRNPPPLAQAAAQPENPRARDLYLRARFLLRMRGSQAGAAPSLLAEALAIDPNYAKAYEALAEYHALRVANHIARPDAELPAGIAAAEKALALAPDFADAHAALGLLRYSAWDFDGAMAEYAAALRLNPNLASAYNRKAVAEYAEGQFPAAERDLLEAQSLDPFNLAHSATLAELYHSWNRFADETRVAHDMLAKDPHYDYAYKLLAQVAFAEGRFDEASSLIARMSNFSDGPTQIVMHDRAHALRNVEDFRRAHTECPAALLATAYAMAGDANRTFDFLRAALSDRDPGLISVKWDPEFAAIRRDARFAEIERTIGREIQ